MDYTRAPLAFRARKAARYVQLYGPRRTFVKVRGQYHMREAGPAVGRPMAPAREDAHVGLIGCGNFAFSHIAYFVERNVGRVMRGAMDIEGARAESIARSYRMHYATDDARRIIDDPKIDLVYVASNHATHADYAIEALQAGKNVHIEKPHVVDDDQLARLCKAMRESTGSVRLGFNRPESRLGLEVQRMLAAQSGPVMLNWFVAGHAIAPDHWYYRPEEGGRVLGNLCHWTDFTLRMIDPAARYPITVTPTRATQPDSDIAVSYVFGDGSIAVITFSAKGHAFEGVREHLELHRGDLLLSLDDFKEVRAHARERRSRTRLRYRDHGQEAAILRSYAMSGRTAETERGVDVEYVWDTAQLFLRTREALEAERGRVVSPFREADLERKPLHAG
ncbi:MAG: Gfo/Idh/MocA family oxidoreductase [Actinomycetota bacterium]|nr:Gfo/Idh/MocA family oxidoreductase [Actinomycetota bacterium]